MTTLQRTTSDHPDFQYLVQLLDEHLRSRDGEEFKFYSQFNNLATIRNVVICYVDGEPIGCGAFKSYDQNTVEIKRMFVKAAYRGKGIGMNILKELELWAAESKHSATILETGTYNQTAIRLYEQAGYTMIKNFGPYEHVAGSVCMRKELS